MSILALFHGLYEVKNNMSYAILRTRKITTEGQIGGMQKHNDRTNNVLNADAELTHMNSTFSISKSNDLRTDIEQRLSVLDSKVKKNNVLAIEHLMTFSPDFISLKKEKHGDRMILRGDKKDIENWNDFNKSCIKWLTDRYGVNNIVHISTHFDEKTPHLHAYVVPIVEKTKKWKNKNGEGEKISKTLSARDFLGGKELMKEMQDSFHHAVSHLGLKRGVKGSVAKHEHIQKYYARVNEAQEINSEMQDYKVVTKKLELSTPPYIGREDWRKNEEQMIYNFLQTEQNENIKAFLKTFEGDIERVIEYKNKEKKHANLVKSLTNDLNIIDNELIKTRMKLKEVSDELKSKNELLNGLKFFLKKALIENDNEALQKILNYINPQKGKGLGM